jgi:hypothetical protein
MEPVKAFLLWAREERIQITRLRLDGQGGIELELADIELAEQYAASARAEAQKAGAWEPPTPPGKATDLYAQLARDTGRDDLADGGDA